MQQVDFLDTEFLTRSDQALRQLNDLEFGYKAPIAVVYRRRAAARGAGHGCRSRCARADPLCQRRPARKRQFGFRAGDGIAGDGGHRRRAVRDRRRADRRAGPRQGEGRDRNASSWRAMRRRSRPAAGPHPKWRRPASSRECPAFSPASLSAPFRPRSRLAAASWSMSASAHCWWPSCAPCGCWACSRWSGSARWREIGYLGATGVAGPRAELGDALIPDRGSIVDRNGVPLARDFGPCGSIPRR